MTVPRTRRALRGLARVHVAGNGTLDTAFGEGGRKLYDMGGPNDTFFGPALSSDGSRRAAVGYPGCDTPGGEKYDGAVLRLQP